MKLTSWFTLGLLASVLAIPAVSRAEEGACKADAEKLCAGIQPGDGRLGECLKSHSNELSEGCKTNLQAKKDEMKASMKQVGDACKADEEKFCKDIQQGGGRKMACLKSHDNELTQGCKDAMASMREHHKKMHQEKKPA